MSDTNFVKSKYRQILTNPSSGSLKTGCSLYIMLLQGAYFKHNKAGKKREFYNIYFFLPAKGKPHLSYALKELIIISKNGLNKKHENLIIMQIPQVNANHQEGNANGNH